MVKIKKLISIMLAYIKMLRMQKNINILFLDEVFSGLDLTSIEDMLILFKKNLLMKEI